MSTHDDQTSDFRGFPGGHVKLPRLNKPKKLVEADAEDAESPPAEDESRSDARSGHDGGSATSERRRAPDQGPIRRNAAFAGSDDQTREVDGSFLDYFTADSLFGASPDPADDDLTDATAAAYSTLGVSRRAPWKTVMRAHRELVAMLHPDRYVDADDEVRAAAEERVRDVNEAYALLREQRSPSRA